ncbi:MAG: RNA polymerase sigma factor RpoD/SigA [Bacteroidetes bacterium]|nr:RNA polymerase sigma factor RpoD/SigA [Bacteroidota bacterium]
MRQLKITQSITNRESASLEKYLQDIGKENMVTPQEEVVLAQRIRQGDQEALDKLTRANLRFVVSVAKQYQNQGMSLPDLINEGNLGLIKAAQRFDETKGFKFISYAVWWIRQSILQAIAEQSRMVRLPLNQIGAMNKVKKALSKLEQKYGRDPSPEEISEAVDLSYNQIRDVLRVGNRPISMDAPFDNNDENNTLLDVLVNDGIPSTDAFLLDESLSEDINRSLSTLSKREAEVIKMFFGIGIKLSMSLDEIGIELGLTRERVRQIKETGLRRLKHNSGISF